jgi:hypothetical protein
MLRCKHYPGVTSQQIEDLGKLVAIKLNSAGRNGSDSKSCPNDLKLTVVYDPLKKVLKVSLKEKPAQLEETHIWSILDYLLIDSPKIVF